MRFQTPMPDRDQAVNSTAARKPCRGSAGRLRLPIRHKQTHAPTEPGKASTYICKLNGKRGKTVEVQGLNFWYSIFYTFSY